MSVRNSARSARRRSGDIVGLLNWRLRQASCADAARRPNASGKARRKVRVRTFLWSSGCRTPCLGTPDALWRTEVSGTKVSSTSRKGEQLAHETRGVRLQIVEQNDCDPRPIEHPQIRFQVAGVQSRPDVEPAPQLQRRLEPAPLLVLDCLLERTGFAPVAHAHPVRRERPLDRVAQDRDQPGPGQVAADVVRGGRIGAIEVRSLADRRLARYLAKQRAVGLEALHRQARFRDVRQDLRVVCGMDEEIGLLDRADEDQRVLPQVVVDRGGPGFLAADDQKVGQRHRR